MLKIATSTSCRQHIFFLIYLSQSMLCAYNLLYHINSYCNFCKKFQKSFLTTYSTDQFIVYKKYNFITRQVVITIKYLMRAAGCGWAIKREIGIIDEFQQHFCSYYLLSGQKIRFLISFKTILVKNNILLFCKKHMRAFTASSHSQQTEGERNQKLNKQLP